MSNKRWVCTESGVPGVPRWSSFESVLKDDNQHYFSNNKAKYCVSQLPEYFTPLSFGKIIMGDFSGKQVEINPGDRINTRDTIGFVEVEGFFIFKGSTHILIKGYKYVTYIGNFMYKEEPRPTKGDVPYQYSDLFTQFKEPKFAKAITQMSWVRDKINGSWKASNEDRGYYIIKTNDGPKVMKNTEKHVQYARFVFSTKEGAQHVIDEFKDILDVLE